jgi:hypothetical protein
MLRVAANTASTTFLRDRLRPRMAKSLEQAGDRVIYASKHGTRFGRIEEFFEILND